MQNQMREFATRNSGKYFFQFFIKPEGWDSLRRIGLPPLAVSLSVVLMVTLLTGCNVERRKSDAELGLNSQQAAGRKIYDHDCDRCHEPYSTRGKKGPGLKGIFNNKELPISGLPANDERVSDIIRLGRKQMPGYSRVLSQGDLDNLLAYLHTL